MPVTLSYSNRVHGPFPAGSSGRTGHGARSEDHDVRFDGQDRFAFVVDERGGPSRRVRRGARGGEHVGEREPAGQWGRVVDGPVGAVPGRVDLVFHAPGYASPCVRSGPCMHSGRAVCIRMHPGMHTSFLFVSAWFQRSGGGPGACMHCMHHSLIEDSRKRKETPYIDAYNAYKRKEFYFFLYI